MRRFYNQNFSYGGYKRTRAPMFQHLFLNSDQLKKTFNTSNYRGTIFVEQLSKKESSYEHSHRRRRRILLP